MMNKFNYSKETLEKLNVHDLRNLAREIGASTSPTTMKKDSLIDLILMRSKGEIEAIESRMGRKPSAGINTLYDSSEFKPITKLTLHSPSYDYDIEPIETQVIFSFDNANSPIIHFTENSGREYKIPVPESQMFRYNLKKGDVLTLKLRYMSDNYYKYNIEKFIAINGVSAESYDRDVFNNLTNNFNTSDCFEIANNEYYYKLFEKQKIKKGQTYFVYSKDNLSSAQDGFTFLKDIMDENVAKIMFSSYKNLNIKEIEYINFNIDETCEDQIKQFTLLQEKIKQLCLTEKQVVLVVNELDEILKSYNYYIQGLVTDSISPDAITAIRKFVNTAKYISNNQNISIFIFSNLVPNNPYSKALMDNVLNRINVVSVPKKYRDLLPF